VGRSRDREKYLANVPSISAEKEVHGRGTGKFVSLSKSSTYPGSQLSGVYCIQGVRKKVPLLIGFLVGITLKFN